MLMEEDRESRLQNKDALKLLPPLFILWVLCITAAVGTFTSGESKSNATLSSGLFNVHLSRIS